MWAFSRPLLPGVTWAISTTQTSGLSRAVQVIWAMAALEIFSPLTNSRRRRLSELSGSLRLPSYGEYLTSCVWAGESPVSAVDRRFAGRPLALNNASRTSLTWAERAATRAGRSLPSRSR